MPNVRTLMVMLGWIGASHVAAGFAVAGPSNSLMDVSRDGKRLLVANPDNDSVTVIDIQARKPVREIKVGQKPEGVTWIGDSLNAAVTLYHADQVIIFDAENGAIVQRVSVPDEPYGIVANRAGTRAWVTHEYPGLVSEIDLEQKAVFRSFKAGSHPRGIALAPDESHLYVTEFYTAILHAIDLRSARAANRRFMERAVGR